MQRILEPELMDDPAEAAEYDAMDHAEVNRALVDDLLAALGRAPGGGAVRVLDLGTGTALIPIELCRRDPAARVVAVDAAESMIRLAERNIQAAGLGDRIEARLADANHPAPVEGPFDVVMSNSIVHHLHDPLPAVRHAVACAAPGGLVFFRDLLRPDDNATVDHLVDLHAADATPRQRQLLADSLRAALSLEEMRALVSEVGADPGGVTQTSDRHWTWQWRMTKHQ